MKRKKTSLISNFPKIIHMQKTFNIIAFDICPINLKHINFKLLKI